MKVRSHTSNFIVNNNDIELKLIIQRPTLPGNTEGLVHEIHISYQGQIIHKYLIDEYLYDLPVDMKLFSIPPDSCGYIDEKEAWFLMTSVAKEIQKKFSSWQEYGENYLIGRQFWSPKYTLSNGYLYTDALKRLTEDADSPWNALPWELNLSE